ALSIRTTDGKKLHIIAYYSKEDHAMRRLMTPTSDPNFPRLVVPPNLYPDMSPESMYGASHSINQQGISNEPDYLGPATADPANLQAFGEAMGGNRSGSGSIVSSSGGGMGIASSSRRRDTMVDTHPRSAHPFSGMAMDISDMHHSGMHSPPASANPYLQQSRHQPPSHHHHHQQHNLHHQQQQQQAPHMRRRPSSPSEHLRMPPISATDLSDSAAKASAAAAASTAAAVDAISAGLHKARVQSLVMDTDIPTPSSLMTSRPAPEQETPQHRVLPLSAPSSSGTRPSSNSFSGSSERRMQLSHGPNVLYERPLGLSTSSSSAPASSVTRPSAAVGAVASNSMLSIGPHAQAIVSEATDMQQQQPLAVERRLSALDRGTRSSSISSGAGSAHHQATTAAIDEVPDLPPMPNTAVPVSSSGNGPRGAKYLGLGGPLGLSNMSVRRSNTMRSVTTAAVMVNGSYGSGSGSGSAGPKLPLLLSPINPPHMSSEFATAAPSISLAAISRDVKEGPRRLPSISANMQTDSPPQSSSSSAARHSCIPGGLGIFNAPVSASSRASSLLPSPMPTPRQSMPRGFDASRVSPRQSSNSLSILAASAADRAHPPPPQFRHASSSYRSSNAHHPYSRTQRKGPSMRSVSLKQSEDIRQLGALDQGLKLK
ncbi:hypothetical protein LPJ57_002098, partial [Coemansia sp. RSA 486]